MIAADVRARLLAGTLTDPHAVLGVHDGVVRAYRPNATAMTLLPQGAKPIAMTSLGDGLFEVAAKVDAYELGVAYGDRRFVIADPYRFAPTVSESDLYLFNEGSQERTWDLFGAHVREHEGVRGVAFAVWAPAAVGVSVVGTHDDWDGRLHMMRQLGSSGVWELFIPGLRSGALYKYEIRTSTGERLLKADPVASASQAPPETASMVFESTFTFTDQPWLARRAGRDPLRSPMSIYELHLGSWKRDPAAPDALLGYRALAPLLADYVDQLGYTHVELLPVAEHPFTGSWGYQVTGHFAPTSRYGTPDDFRWFVDFLHARGIGVIVDWVPAHFPRDAFALARFDGTALYEHLDPRQGEQPDWGTYVFNFGRREVKSFLIGSALAWLDEFHVDGLRVDAVASMLYLDYSRKDGEWVPNAFGGRENLEAIALLRELNERVYAKHPGVMMIAEESTAWPGVSRPTYVGGLGFGFKWNMGWMHDTLAYFELDPIYRRYHPNKLTFASVYAFTENFVLPLSHDEIVHGKKSLLDKMPGDRWQKMANLRALYGFQWAHAGKKLLFMGCDIAQEREWSHDRSLDWHLLDEPDHAGMQRLVADLNRVYKAQRALWDADHEPAGMRWIDTSDVESNVLVLLRTAPSTGEQIVCVLNLSPVPRESYRVGLPGAGFYEELLNTDASAYGGSNVGNYGGVQAEAVEFHGMSHSALLTLPPLAVLYLKASTRSTIA